MSTVIGVASGCTLEDAVVEACGLGVAGDGKRGVIDAEAVGKACGNAVGEGETSAGWEDLGLTLIA